MAMAWQLLLAVVLGLALGATLGGLLLRLWLPRYRRHQDQQQTWQQQRVILDSLSVLCRAVDQQQMELSEAVIRLSALLDSLPAEIAPKVDVAAIHQLAELCDAFARGGTRKAMTAQQRHQQDQQRWQLEEQQGEAVGQAVTRLQAVLPAWRAQLKLTDNREK